MISRPPIENRGRRRRLGIGGSLSIHLVIALLFVLLAPLFPETENETRTSSPEVVTITHRPKHAVAVVQPRPVSVAPPRHAAVVQPAAKAAPPKLRPAPELPKPAVAPRVAPVTAVPKVVHHPHRRAAAVAAAAPKAAPVAAPGAAAHATYSKSHIDEIEHDLAQSIAAQRSGINPLAAPSEPAPEIKHYGPAIAAFDIGDARTHHGLCDPIRQWVEAGYDYYYVACNVRFSDGTMQRESVPWPVRFEPNDDPFSGTAGHDLPLAMPLPGWHTAPGAYVSKELREYARDHGVTI